MDQHLDFEQPIYTCLEKIEELKKIVPAPANLADEIALLERQSHEETEKIWMKKVFIEIIDSNLTFFRGL